jgi:hypothetical protein
MVSFKVVEGVCVMLCCAVLLSSVYRYSTRVRAPSLTPRASFACMRSRTAAQRETEQHRIAQHSIA